MSNFDRDAKPENIESYHFYLPVTVRVLRANPNVIEFTLPQSGLGSRWLCVLYNADPKDLIITPPLTGECTKLARFIFHHYRNERDLGISPTLGRCRKRGTILAHRRARTTTNSTHELNNIDGVRPKIKKQIASNQRPLSILGEM